MWALGLTIVLVCPHDGVLAEEARAARVPPLLVQAVARVESNCDTSAISETDARGLLQVLASWLTPRRGMQPPWLRDNLKARCGADLHDPRINACWGARLLRYEFLRAGGDWSRALRAYSGGAYPRYEQRVRRQLRRVTDLALAGRDQPPG